MKTLSRWLAAAALALAAALPALAEPAPTASPYKVSLITILPGKALYSSFGHSGLRVVDTRSGRDLFYNYGLSAHPFDAKFALGMFAGRMEFMVGAGGTSSVLGFYSGVENRTIIEQDLALDDAQAAALVAALRHDARPENRVYNYRYFSDNCTTRVAVMLQRTAGEDPGSRAVDPSMTVRASVNGTLAGRPWLTFVVNLLMGPTVDREARTGDPIFLPGHLMDWADGASNGGASDPAARDRPFVSVTRTLYEAVPDEGGPAGPGPAAVAAAFLVAALAVTALRGRARPLAAAFDAVLASLALVVGAAILLFWLCADYGEAAWNLNLLWASALPLLALILGGRRLPAKARSASAALYAVSAACAALVAVAGGFGAQSVLPAARLVALALAIRWADRAGALAAAERLVRRPRA
ncbi:MAG: DUF4105 domain-containing protein [Spirochaetaceae bacterium]|nr:DUF4105 domain-containing protein [Spirochaetaceae bacterium]